MSSRTRIASALAAAAISLAAPCVAYYEGMVPHTYADPVGIPTICYGHTGADVTPGLTATPADCNKLLQGDLSTAFAAVTNCISADLTPHEAAAMVSFTYSVGGNALCASTLAKMANAGAEPIVWCHQLLRWTHVKRLGVAVELPGLVARRSSEYQMCITPN